MSNLNRFVRDSFWGRVIYHISGHKLFHHPEESPDYVIPDKYLEDLKRVDTNSSKAEVVVPERDDSTNTSNFDDKTQHNDERIIVGWEGDDDPENPKNWSILGKSLVTFQICFLTTVVYMSSAIFTPGIESMMEDLGVSRVKATLPLTMFVVGYGIGPMLLSPLSENAIFGRTYIYIITLFIFFILQIPISLVNNLPALATLRVFSGLVASPCLATGGASLGDITNIPYIPFALTVWAISSVLGPSLGPLFGSILVVKRDWHWTFWLITMTSGIALIVFSFCLPETYEKTLLLRKAKRLRKVTGNPNIISQGELENESLTVKQLAIETFWRPIEISLFEPVVLLINVYVAFMYAIMYLWFEAFPIAYIGTYHFTLIEMGTTYLSVIVGVLIGAVIYQFYMYKTFVIPFRNNEPMTPESFIPIMIFGSVFMPIGIFIFGWTISPDTHWFGSLVGAAIFNVTSFIIIQSSFLYLANSFPRYMASVFAGNALFRANTAAVFPLFGNALFNNVATTKFPVGWGSSILAFICVAMIAIPVLFYLNGPKLRARSRYSGFT